MNKILSFLFVMVFVFVISATLVVAQEESANVSDIAVEEVAAETEITTQDLGVDDPGILPTSRFYFFKNFTRGVKRVFTFDPVKKAELELNIANEQAAEIVKMKEVTPERTDAIAKAAGNYQQNVDRLKTRLNALKETSENPNINKLMENLADRSVKHQQLFDELKHKFEDKPELKQNFEKMQEKMNEATVKIPEKFDSPEMFKERMKKAIEARPDNPFRELRGMEMMEKIEEKLPEDRREGLEGIKDDLMKKFEDRINAMPEEAQRTFMVPHILERMPSIGDPDFDLKMRVLDDVKGRVLMPSAMREQMEVAKDQILESAALKGELTKEKAEEQIRRAEKSIGELGITIDEPGTHRADTDITRMKNLLDQAKKHLDEAKTALEASKYGEAFGHATSADMIARNALKGNVLFKSQPVPLPELILPTSNVCPQIAPPSPIVKDKCASTGGRLEPNKNESGCIVGYECKNTIPSAGTVQPSSGGQIVCTQEYLPVCGVNGKTYPNKCYAQKAGIIIKTSGVCQSVLTPIYPR